MRSAFTETRTIPAPPAEVWAALTDWQTASSWMPGVTAMSANAPLAAGTVLNFEARGKARSSTITALEPGRSITLSSTVPGVTADYVYTVEAKDDGSLVGLDARVATKGLMVFLGPVIRNAIAKEDGVQLERLAAMIAAKRDTES